MSRYIAFLRAINVGGHTVKMDHLRTLFESLKLRRVETFIASGNVIFDTGSSDTDALEQRIEKHLERALGYEVATFLRTPEALADIVAHEPFGAGVPNAEQRLQVGFLKGAPSKAGREKFLSLRTEVDDFHLHRSEAYWLRLGNISDSKISGNVMEKALGPATFRNVTTVRKLAEKYRD